MRGARPHSHCTPADSRSGDGGVLQHPQPPAGTSKPSEAPRGPHSVKLLKEEPRAPATVPRARTRRSTCLTPGEREGLSGKHGEGLPQHSENQVNQLGQRQQLSSGWCVDTAPATMLLQADGHKHRNHAS